MKTFPLAIIVLLSWSLLPVRAATTIDSVNKYAYGANIGWMDWSGGTGQTASGAVIGDYACSGYIYSANVGWINLGNGSPANDIYYQNNSAGDFGVNQDGLGNLRGYAYGANIGWINFESTGAPAANRLTGQLSGWVWSANCGWISLNNTHAYVQTDTLYPGPLAPDGLPIPWLLTYFGATNVNANSDPDGSGMTVGQDYLAGTDPTNPNSKLQIISAAFSPRGASATITWSSVPTRLYYIQKNLNLVTTNWVDSGLGLISPDGASTTRTFTNTSAPACFYRIHAVSPLAP